MKSLRKRLAAALLLTMTLAGSRPSRSSTAW